MRVAGDSAGTETAGGLFLLAWGLFATTGGVLLVTNYRGFAERFVTLSRESVSGLRRLPPWRWMPGSSASWVGVGFLRLLGMPFAVLGPVVLIAGIVLTAQGRLTQPNLEPPPLPFQAIGVVIFLTGVVALWIRNGFLSTAWRRGGWYRWISVFATSMILPLGVGWSTGNMALLILGWLLGGLSSLALLVSPPADDKQADPGADPR